MSENWTPERDSRLTVLWSLGHSTETIGRMMATTKNAVIGRAHRLKLPRRESPIGQSPERRLELDWIQTVRPKVVPFRSLPPPPKRTLPVLDETQDLFTATIHVIAPEPKPTPTVFAHGMTCQFPFGEPRHGDFHFCDDPRVVLGKPYCREHCAVAYTQRAPSRISPGGQGSSSHFAQVSDIAVQGSSL